MRFSKHLYSGAALAVFAAGMAPVAMAQTTTSGITGTVKASDGAPVDGAAVVVTDTRTGLTRATTTTPAGNFDFRNLNVGGPYTVSVSAPNQQPTRVEGIVISLGAPTDLNLSFSGTAARDVIVVSAQEVNAQDAAIGPSSVFGLSTLENSPAINRDIKDIIRLDPRVTLDYAAGGASGSNGIQCGGAHTRFNSLTVDGVRLNDNFGLNTNGYPTERIPFSYDAIQQVAVELAPFDVQYGGFTACNINAVTKSGTNTLHGGFFYDYTDDGMFGDSTDGIKRDLGSFDEKRYGATLSGPIIPNTLFFFAAYEKFEGANIFGKQPGDVGLSDAAYQNVLDIATNQYGYTVGGLPTSIPVEDEKFFTKIDWNINDRHRAAFTYMYNDGFNLSPSDSSSSQIADYNHFYERGAELNAYTASLYSDWTDDFSTEVRVSNLKLDNRQTPVWGYDNWGEVQISVPRDLGGTGNVTVYLGADDSRHANKLNYEMWNYKLAGTYRLGDHILTGGYEREEFSVFNQFIQEVLGEWRFSSPTDFANGDFNYFEYSNAVGTNNPDDGAASFGYEINTLYFQDEWTVNDVLDIVAGLRYDFYTSSDKPRYNQNFVNNYGYANNENMDGRDILQPRLGFTWSADDNVTVRGGLGLFSGGNPNVWISNDYSNDGVTLADYIVRGGNLGDYTYPDTGNPFFDVPQEGIDYIAGAAGVGSVNALDPNFKIPSEWKVALGTTINFDTGKPWLGDDWTVQLDFLHSKTNESAVVIPIGYTQTDTAPDGRPIYGRPPSNTNDFLLTNADEKGSSTVLSALLHKDYGNGIDWSLGYAHTDAEDTNPMTSSVAYSNFANYTTSDPMHIATATSDYEVKNRFTFQFNWEIPWKDRWETRFSLFGSAQEGAPYSYTFGRNSLIEGANNSSRQLAYIPTGIDDPLLTSTTAAGAQAIQDLVAFVNSHDVLSEYKGQIAPRNVGNDDWYTKFDLRISQSIPGFMADDKAEAFVVIENIGNLLNDSWGIQREHGFPGSAELYNISGITNGQYVVSGFNSAVDDDSIVVGSSLWNVRFGVKYNF
ncbi:MAG: carboxypeptidase regulatory-like domain-containing protein [Hyphomonadaceae bacterium]